MYRVLACFAVAVLLALRSGATPATAYESVGDTAQLLSLDRLPREVSATLNAWKPACGDRLTAGRMFARVTEVSGRRYLTLHFEELACVDRSAICTAAGCHHEVYVLSQGRFHRVFSRDTTGLNLKDDERTAVLELDCGLLGCLRALRWDGHAFLETSAKLPDTEHIFGFTEGADVGLKGENEAETTFTSRFGKPGRYAAFEGETAFRHLWDDGVRTSLSLLSDAHDVHGVPGLQDVSTVAFNGLGSEFRWQALTRDNAPAAFALSFEPQWRRLDDISGRRQETWVLPVIALVDFAVVPGKIFAAVNVSYAPSFARLPGTWDPQSNLEVSAAISAALRPDMFIGAEVRQLVAYQGTFLNRSLGEATFVGPSVFVALPDEFTVKIAWSAQVAGHTAATPAASVDLVDFERQQARLQLLKGF